MHPLAAWLEQQKRNGVRVTRRELAERVGCGPSWLTDIIRHGATPSLPLAYRLSEVTGIPLERFVEGGTR